MKAIDVDLNMKDFIEERIRSAIKDFGSGDMAADDFVTLLKLILNEKEVPQITLNTNEHDMWAMTREAKEKDCGNTNDWKERFDEVIPELMTIDFNGKVVEAPLPDLVKERIKAFISKCLREQAEQLIDLIEKEIEPKSSPEQSKVLNLGLKEAAAIIRNSIT